jgi:hypothetical protein
MVISKRIRQSLVVLAGLSLVLVPAAAFASNAPNFTQTINAGTLTAGIVQTDDSTAVSAPAVAFGAQPFSFTCKTSTGTLFDGVNADSGQLNVTNLDTSVNSWTIALAATGGDSATWSDGTHTYKYNDATGSGCTYGQLTVDPSAGTVTDDCNSACASNDSTVIKPGSSSAFLSSAGSTAPITLLSDTTAGATWEGYLKNVGLSQKIPAQQHDGSYQLGMTVTLSST